MSTASSALYYLPSHPQWRCLDPLSLTDVDDPSDWDVITAATRQFRGSTPKLTNLPVLIHDISYSIHQNGQLDTTLLSDYLSNHLHGDGSPENLLDQIICSVYDTPVVFPSHTIPYLTPESPKLTLTSRQIRCLLSHQLLNTLKPPPNNTWGCTFVTWYSQDQPLPFAIRGYLDTVFQFFDRKHSDDHDTTYELITLPMDDPNREPTPWFSSNEAPFCTLSFQPTTSTTTPFPHSVIDCTLVSSNKEPGFGASCTQEELVTGASPALLPLGALFIPSPLPADTAILVTGFNPMTQWTGMRREARRTGDLGDKQHSFLLLDAAELDGMTSSDKLSDLTPQNLMRDLTKAYTGFKALSTHHIQHIFSPIWGAGAFGGDPVVKTVILALVAARTGINITLLVDMDSHLGSDSSGNLLKSLEALKARSEKENWTIGCVMRAIYDSAATDTVDLLSRMHNIVP